MAGRVDRAVADLTDNPDRPEFRLDQVLDLSGELGDLEDLSIVDSLLYLSHDEDLATLTVFLMSMATVRGPTPPGTGVMWEATSVSAPKSASPTRV